MPTSPLNPLAFRVADLGSTNGCFINGKLVADEIIQVGDQFAIGTVQLGMSLKMQRNLAIADETSSSSKEPGQTATNVPAKKMDPSLLKEKTTKVTGPITWKNLPEEDDPKKSKMTGIFSKMFSKKP